MRRFIQDAALFWLESYGVDGLRWDMTLEVRNALGGETDDAHDLPDGWSLMHWVNEQIAERLPGRITIAEDLRLKDEITAPTAEGGAGFDTQWDADFVHPVREVLTVADDDARSMAAVVGALTKSNNGDPFRRVVYTESHDKVANGKSRIPHEVDRGDQRGWFAQKRSTLGAALIFTAPGIPMIFQGQELLQGNWFDDTVPMGWAQQGEFRGIVRLFSDLTDLRLTVSASRERGVDLPFADDKRKIVAFRRFVGDGSPDVPIALNFRANAAQDVTIALPKGYGSLRLNSDWSGYSDDFGSYSSRDIQAADSTDAANGSFSIDPYSALVFIRDA